jgi:hypoxanthine phosphoribosyltransferase
VSHLEEPMMTYTHPELSAVLISAERIQTRVTEIAQEIARDYAGVERLYLVGILKGAFIFLADLSRALSQIEGAPPHVIDFIALSSYGRSTQSGEVRLVMDLRDPIVNQHVLLVEDIVDTGRTLNYLIHSLQGRGPATLRSCALVRKERPGVDTPIDYLGFTIPDVWVVGYGLDYADTHRTLPFIAELRREVYAA